MTGLFDSLTEDEIEKLLKRLSEGEGSDELAVSEEIKDESPPKKKSEEEVPAKKETKSEDKTEDDAETESEDDSKTESDSKAVSDTKSEIAESKTDAKADSEIKAKDEGTKETETKTDAVTIGEDGGIFSGGLTKTEASKVAAEETAVPEVKSIFDATPKVDLTEQVSKAKEETTPATKVTGEEAPTITPLQEALAAIAAKTGDAAVVSEEPAVETVKPVVKQKEPIGDTPITPEVDVISEMPDTTPAVTKVPQDVVISDQVESKPAVSVVPPVTQTTATESANVPVTLVGATDDRQEAQASAAAAAPQTVSNIFATPTLTPVVKSVKEAGGDTTTSVDSTGNIIQLPTFVEKGTPIAPSDVFTPGQLGNAPELGGIKAGISPGTGIGAAGGGPVSNVQLGDQTITISFDDIVGKAIQDEIDAMRAEGVFSSDPEFGTRLEVAANRGLDIYNQDVARAKELGRYIDLGPQKGATTPGQGGIPLILPIPGLDPVTAAALTGLGLIFSGGKIARLNPQNPAGSVAGAVQGIGQTGQNVINVATGQDTLGNIWSGGTAPSTGTGTGAAATGAGQQTTGTGAIGAVGGIFGGGTSGAGGATGGQQTTTGGTVGVTPGALGGDTGQAPSTTTTTTGTTKPADNQQVPSTGGPYIYDTAERNQNILGQILAPSQAIQQQAAQEKAAADANAWITGIVSGAAAKRDELSSQQTTGVTATSTSTTTSTTTDVKPDASGYIVTNTPSGIRIQSPVQTVGDYTVKSTPQIDLAGDVTSGPPGVTPTPSSTVPTSTTPTTSGTAATPIVINAPTVGYTLPQAGTPAARNLYTEAGTTLSSLASPMQRFQIGVDAGGQPIYGTIPQTGGRPSTLSEAIAQGYGGLAGGMREADVQNLFGAIGAATGRTPTAQGGYQAELNRAAAEQTAAANAALRLGNIMDAETLSARAQALRQQANPELFGAGGALPQYTAQAREQAARDLAALRTAESGQLTPEQIRNAQQAAREAYSARGQVFSEGAKAQEVLNRQQMIQQQQQIARQNLAQSMGQLGQGVAYQTANIFDPMAATLGGQYGMQSQNVGMNQALYNQAMGLTSGAGGYGFAQQMINPFSGYAQDVYGTNVNALNAAQIAAANRQAALEAAKMGQTGTYAQALGNLIASGGLGQIQSGITGGVQGLLNLLGGKWPTS